MCVLEQINKISTNYHGVTVTVYPSVHCPLAVNDKISLTLQSFKNSLHVCRLRHNQSLSDPVKPVHLSFSLKTGKDGVEKQ